MYRLSKTPIEVCGLNAHASRSLFLVFIVTCVKLLNSHVWRNFVSERMKIKQRERVVVIKNCVVCISVTKKQSQFILNWGPCPPIVTSVPNTVYTFCYFVGLRRGCGKVPPSSVR